MKDSLNKSQQTGGKITLEIVQTSSGAEMPPKFPAETLGYSPTLWLAAPARQGLQCA
jgi:hypothetical protein